ARLRPYRPRFPSRGSGAVALAIVLALWVARGSAAPAPGAPGTGPALRAPAPAAPNLPAREPLHPQPPDVLKAVEPNGPRLLAKVLGSASLEPAAIEAGKAALKHRIAALDDDLTSSSYQELLLQMYPTTPYGRPVPGYPSSLDRIGRKELEAFYHAHYVQNNMVVAVVGNIETEAAVQQTRKAFDRIPFRPHPAEPSLPPPDFSRPRPAMRRRPAPAAQVMLGTLAPPTTVETYPTWTVLDAIIGGGKRARLFTNLREKYGIGYMLGSFYQPLLDGGHLVAYVVTEAYRADPQTRVPALALDLVRNRMLEQLQSLA